MKTLALVSGVVAAGFGAVLYAEGTKAQGSGHDLAPTLSQREIAAGGVLALLGLALASWAVLPRGRRRRR